MRSAMLALNCKSPTLSMNPPLIPVVKRRLSEISIADAKSLTERALKATSPAEVRKMIRERLPDSHS